VMLCQEGTSLRFLCQWRVLELHEATGLFPLLKQM
jgi:hypothetical protein